MLARKETSSSFSIREFNTADTMEMMSLSRNNPSPKMTIVLPRKEVPPIFTCISNQNLAYIFVIVSSCLLVMGYSFSSYKNVDPIETTLIRFIFQSVLQGLIVIKNNTKLYIFKSRDHKVVLIRALFAASHAFILALAQYYISLSVIFTINSSGIIFAFVLNYFKNHVKVTESQLRGIICGLIGLVLVITGRCAYSIIYSGYRYESLFPNYRVEDNIWNLLCSVIFMFWMVFWAYSLLHGGNQAKMDFNLIIFINSVVGLFVFGLLYQTLTIRSNFSLFAQIGLTTGVMLTISNYLFSWGLYISTNMGMVSLINQFTIVVSYAISIFFYHQSINLIACLGSLLTIIGIKLILIKK